MIEQYHEIEACLREACSQYSASECQGVLCGVLVLDGSSLLSQWVEEVVEGAELSEANIHEIRRLLTDLSRLTQQRLNDPSISFTLLLPEEDQVSLLHRVEALSDWCRGFLYGLSLAGINDKPSLPKDSAEFIEDVLEISRAIVASDDGEADEGAFVELEEYLRIGVLLMLEEDRYLARDKLL